METFKVENCVRGITISRAELRLKNLQRCNSEDPYTVAVMLREVCSGLCRSVVSGILSNSCPFFWHVSVIP